MKKCELCTSIARMYCDSDQANLCWDCDAKVHAANFLVAKHSRTLLCQACQSPTPWAASGPRLGTTVSVCQNCVGTSSHHNQDHRRDHDDLDSQDHNSEEQEEEEEEEEEEEDDCDEDSDNQVVPLSPAPLSRPSPPVSSFSSSKESSNRLGWGRDSEYESNSTIVICSKRTADYCSLGMGGSQDGNSYRKNG